MKNEEKKKRKLAGKVMPAGVLAAICLFLFGRGVGLGSGMGLNSSGSQPESQAAVERTAAEEKEDGQTETGKEDAGQTASVVTVRIEQD